MLEQLLQDLPRKGFKGNISVDLGKQQPSSGTYQDRKAAWLRFYGQRGFVREYEGNCPRPDDNNLRLTLEV